MKTFLIAALIAVPLAASARGNDKKVDASKVTPSQLIGKLSAKNKMQYDLGSIAQAQGENRKVKELGARLVKDHARLQKVLEDYARETDLTLADAERDYDRLVGHTVGAEKSMEGEAPAEAGKAKPEKAEKSWKADRDEKLERIRAMSGAKFDREFLTRIAKSSQRTISFLDEYKASHPDKKLGGVIDEFSTTLRDHQHEAERLQGELPAT